MSIKNVGELFPVLLVVLIAGRYFVRLLIHDLPLLDPRRNSLSAKAVISAYANTDSIFPLQSIRDLHIFLAGREGFSTEHSYQVSRYSSIDQIVTFFLVVLLIH